VRSASSSANNRTYFGTTAQIARTRMSRPKAPECTNTRFHSVMTGLRRDSHRTTRRAATCPARYRSKNPACETDQQRRPKGNIRREHGAMPSADSFTGSVAYESATPTPTGTETPVVGKKQPRQAIPASLRVPAACSRRIFAMSLARTRAAQICPTGAMDLAGLRTCRRRPADAMVHRSI